MQGCECGSDEVRLLAGIQHKQAELVDETELCVQRLLEVVCLGLQGFE